MCIRKKVHFNKSALMVNRSAQSHGFLNDGSATYHENHKNLYTKKISTLTVLQTVVCMYITENFEGNIY